MTQTRTLLEQLISIPSVSGDEVAILAFCRQWLTDHGANEVISEPLFTAGVVRARGESPATRALIFCGHVDTVAAGDESAWIGSPWQPRQEGDRLHGLGSSDMKAGVAAQMTAFAHYATAPRDDLDVWCVQVANEEVDGAGSAAFAKFFAAQTRYQQADCLIAEPTDMTHIEIGHRGNRFIELIFTGESGHASQEQHYDRSALPKVVSFLEALPEIQSHLHAAYHDETLGQPSFTPTRISPEGSYSSNKTAAAALVAVDVRTTPSLDTEFDSWITMIAKQYGATWRYAAEPVSSALCPSDASIIQQLQRAASGTTVTVSPGATDQAFFQAIGINTVVFGPGNFDQAHVVNESVSLANLAGARQVYQQLIDDRSPQQGH